MEAVTILRELWRRRLLVGLLAIVCVLVGLALTYTVSFPPESRKYEVSIATGRILVDTPDSQVVDVAPRGSDTLGVRANLMANLMSEGKVKALIAKEAGLPAGELQAGVEFEGELPVGLANSVGNPDAHLLITRLATSPDGVLPIVELEAQAPDAKQAGDLASAAVVGLREYLASKAATEDVKEARRLRVTGLGTPQVREAVRGPQRLVAVGVAVFIFLLGCTAIAIAPAVARSWRVAAAGDRTVADPAPGQGVGEPSTEDKKSQDSSPELWLPGLRDKLVPTRRPAAGDRTAADPAPGQGVGEPSTEDKKSQDSAPQFSLPGLRDKLVPTRRPAAGDRTAADPAPGQGVGEPSTEDKKSQDSAPQFSLRGLRDKLVPTRRPAARGRAAAGQGVGEQSIDYGKSEDSSPELWVPGLRDELVSTRRPAARGRAAAGQAVGEQSIDYGKSEDSSPELWVPGLRDELVPTRRPAAGTSTLGAAEARTNGDDAHAEVRTNGESEWARSRSDSTPVQSG